jgi:hypothetical protein
MVSSGLGTLQLSIGLPLASKTNTIALDNLQAHIHIAELLLNEVALQDDHPLSKGLQPTDRLEVLWKLLNAGKAFMNLRFATSLLGTPRFLCVSTYDSMFAFFTCLKLVNLDLPGWHLDVVRQHLNLEGMIDNQIGDLELFCATREKDKDRSAPRNDPDPFLKLVGMLKAVRSVLSATAPLLATTEAGTDQAMLTPLTPTSWTMDGDNNVQYAAGLAELPTSMSTWQEFLTDSLWTVDDGEAWPEPENLQMGPAPHDPCLPTDAMHVEGE